MLLTTGQVLDGVLQRQSGTTALAGRAPGQNNRLSSPGVFRTPGIGPVSTERILRTRRTHRFTRLTELSRLGVASSRARDFILISGRFYPTPPAPAPAPAPADSINQLDLFTP